MKSKKASYVIAGHPLPVDQQHPKQRGKFWIWEERKRKGPIIPVVSRHAVGGPFDSKEDAKKALAELRRFEDNVKKLKMSSTEIAPDAKNPEKPDNE